MTMAHCPLQFFSLITGAEVSISSNLDSFKWPLSIIVQERKGKSDIGHWVTKEASRLEVQELTKYNNTTI